MSHASLSCANLKRANLRDSQALGTDFEKAQLSHADFILAVFIESNFKECVSS
ncbi:pentapeptide repeat-containing protein [Leptothermofonsia sp. ETS-13]|uniref:pentapeptide repeat-containing protein n=1 Tax=Leptothermofonsia sp. ETS-13 TaxID=3035696 RepID=UPI003BA02CAA